MELEWLYNRKGEIEDEMSHFFDGIDDPNEGDRGYQRLWEELDSIDEQIKEINEKNYHVVTDSTFTIDTKGDLTADIKCKNMNEKKTKGYIAYGDRKMCEDCIFMKWVGTGSRSQQMTYCTKIQPNFIVMLEDVCDEFEGEDGMHHAERGITLCRM